MKKKWTPQMETTLRQMWDDSKSARTIGNEIGMSRNAVIGKVHRLKLKGRGRGNNEERALRKSRNRNDVKITMRKSVPPHQPIPTTVASDNPVTLMELRPHHCRYPLWPERPAFYCGNPAEAGPYCADHARKCYTTLYAQKLAAEKTALMRAAIMRKGSLAVRIFGGG